ncbi:hypothetical protein H7J87_11760 [Mycolicibacterium wolinskyi]|uniref:hypothetical protein n=1 Tax=Mycolicibacterium TaxID=1866885 RepID=UPI0013FE4DE9|nr:MULTISPECIES: hypothetical protein [Mycolicibacterium]MCV7286006.1 hypothetical protein [Mycolicibacterium wolinskyi]MCV7296202.1 hypothetical protein [Mycolicibacterium goodii]
MTAFIALACAGVVFPVWAVAIAIPASGAIMGAVLASVTRRLADQYRAAFGDVASRADHAAAVRASMSGPIPAEGDVLTAARRLAWLSVRLYRQAGIWMITGAWLCAASIFGLGVIPGIATADTSLGAIAILWLLAVVYAGVAVWIHFDRRRATRRATRLELDAAFKTVTYETS